MIETMTGAVGATAAQSAMKIDQPQHALAVQMIGGGGLPLRALRRGPGTEN
jgi:hypothetical protein